MTAFKEYFHRLFRCPVLFDREYVSSCYSEYACYWGAERQVVATATFRF